MIKILSRPLWCRVKSDAEYIETVRKRVRIRKRVAVICGVSSLVFFVAAIWVVNLFLGLFSEGHRLNASAVRVLGLLVGGLGGFLVSAAILHLAFAMNFLFGYRTERLLLKYFDMASSTKGNL